MKSHPIFAKFTPPKILRNQKKSGEQNTFPPPITEQEQN